MSDQRLLRFSDTPGSSISTDQSRYQLLALPPTLLSLLTSTEGHLEIRGNSTDSAALVTPDQTFALRGVQNSNSLCICSSGPDGGSDGKWFNTSRRTLQGGDSDGEQDDETRPRKRVKEEIEIESVLHETLEAVVGVARTDKLASYLKGCYYRGESIEADTPPTRQVSFDDLRSRLPASDAEIRTALTKLRVVDLDDTLRPIPTSFLLGVLPSLLSSLPLPAVLAHTTTKLKKIKAVTAAKGKEKIISEAEEAEVVDALDSVDCGRLVALAIMQWFGQRVSDMQGRWTFEVETIVRELGIVLLAEGGFGKQPFDTFLAKWKDLCGGFGPLCDASLLSGVKICQPPPLNTIQYLPSSSLSPDPATRFSELFSLQPRWPEAEMGLFIDDLTAGNKKKRDALVLKFVRKVKEKDETFWTPRNLWT